MSQITRWVNWNLGVFSLAGLLAFVLILCLGVHPWASSLACILTAVMVAQVIHVIWYLR